MADLQKYVNWDGLVYYDGKIKNFIKDKLSPCFKFAGVFAAEELPAPEELHKDYVPNRHVDVNRIINGE